MGLFIDVPEPNVEAICDECRIEIFDGDGIYCRLCYQGSDELADPDFLHNQLRDWVDSEQLGLTPIERIFLENVIEAIRKSLPLSTIRRAS